MLKKRQKKHEKCLTNLEIVHIYNVMNKKWLKTTNKEPKCGQILSS